MSDQAKHSVSVAGVVVGDDGQVLLIQRRDNGHWEPPGGVLELNETFEEGVIREVLEETGIKVAVGSLTGVYKNMELGVVALVFRCSQIGGSLTGSPETVAARWFEKADAAAMMSPAFAVRVTDALEQTGVHARAHDGSSLLRAGPAQEDQE
jgi:8-oxo-dGTP pyrophosphatase MutT (NUDIX family)